MKHKNITQVSLKICIYLLYKLIVKGSTFSQSLSHQISSSHNSHSISIPFKFYFLPFPFLSLSQLLISQLIWWLQFLDLIVTKSLTLLFLSPPNITPQRVKTFSSLFFFFFFINSHQLISITFISSGSPSAKTQGKWQGPLTSRHIWFFCIVIIIHCFLFSILGFQPFMMIGLSTTSLLEFVWVQDSICFIIRNKAILQKYNGLNILSILI